MRNNHIRLNEILFALEDNIYFIYICIYIYPRFIYVYIIINNLHLKSRYMATF